MLSKHRDTDAANRVFKGAPEFNFNFSASELRGLRQGEEHWQMPEIPDDLWSEVDRTASFIKQSLGVFQQQSAGGRLFIDSIIANGPVAPSFYDGWKAQEGIDAAISSHEQGHWIALQTKA